jgi:hypothetical protein
MTLVVIFPRHLCIHSSGSSPWIFGQMLEMQVDYYLGKQLNRIGRDQRQLCAKKQQDEIKFIEEASCQWPASEAKVHLAAPELPGMIVEFNHFRVPGIRVLYIGSSQALGEREISRVLDSMQGSRSECRINFD